MHAKKIVRIFFITFLLLKPSAKSIEFSSFILLDTNPQFTSSALDQKVWSSRNREYCFEKKELSFQLMYEFSPMPLPAFKIAASISAIYITADIDELNSFRYQTAVDAWKEFSRLKEKDTICFKGAYLPALAANEITSIIVTDIESENLHLAMKDFVIGPSN